MPYYTSASYYPAGILKSATYGNTVQLAVGANQREDITSLAYMKGSTALLSKSYVWDSNALNLLSITDQVQGFVRKFSYDYLNRIQSANDTVTGQGPGVNATGTVSINGAERSTTTTICQTQGGVRRCTPTTVYDQGSVTIIVSGTAFSAPYGGSSTPSSIAAALAAAINASASGPATATVNGTTITLTATDVGPAGDESLSGTSATIESQYFAGASFTAGASGGNLTGGAKGNLLSVAYTPDAWGNLEETGTQNFVQPSGTNNQIQSAGYVFDASGNQTSDGLGNTYSYDAESKMASSNGATYTRDPLGQRVRKDGSGDPLEYNFFGGRLLATHDPSSGQWTDYIWAGGRLIAENPGSQNACATFRLGDHLDSLAQTNDCAGDILGIDDFAPYGQPVNATASSRILFTQHEHDSENNSENTLYRQLASTQSRWLSPDPSNGSYDLTDPQSFNRYTYLRNRPLSSVDQFGLDDDDDDDDDDDSGGNGTDGGGVDSGSGFASGADATYGDDSSSQVVTNTPSYGSMGLTDGFTVYFYYGTGSPVGESNGATGGTDAAVLGPFQASFANIGFIPGGLGSNAMNAAQAPSKGGCKASSGPSSIVTFTATKDLTEVGAAIGSLFGPEGTVIGAVLGSQFGVGGNISYVNSTHSLYIGPTAVFAPLQVGGGGGFSLSYTNVPASQNANSIANGTSYGVAFQPNILFGSVVSKSPGSGPPVVGYQVGTVMAVPPPDRLFFEIRS